MTAAAARGEGFGQALARLAESPAPDAAWVAELSGPGADDLARFRAAWPALPVERRRWLVRELVSRTEADFEVDFKRLFVVQLDDPDADVRSAAIAGLWEARDLVLVERFTRLLQLDAEPAVRSAAAAALGPFVELAQLGRLDADLVRPALDALLAAAANATEDVQVRRRALESVGYADEAPVAGLIRDALASPDRARRAGALRAMGNSSDERWASEIVARLDDRDAELRFEAARAAGELGLPDAVRALAELATGTDREIQLEAIWALGEIGGARARHTLERLLADEPDEDLEEAIEDALASAALSDGEVWWDTLLDGR